jgi:hypothetical protein
MATKAERFRSEQERAHITKPPAKPTSQRKPKKAALGRKKGHAAVKATHALEEVGPGKRPSRKSTRASANRAKADVGFNRAEQIKKGSPTARAKKARAQRATVRGTPRGSRARA